MNSIRICRSAMMALAIFVSSSALAVSADAADKPNLKQLKDQVVTGLDMAAYAKLSVSEVFLTEGKWPDNNDEAKVAPVIDTDFTIKVGKDGVITIVYLDPAELAGKSIVMTPSKGENQSVNWACKSIDIPVQYLPKRCK